MVAVTVCFGIPRKELQNDVAAGPSRLIAAMTRSPSFIVQSPTLARVLKRRRVAAGEIDLRYMVFVVFGSSLERVEVVLKSSSGENACSIYHPGQARSQPFARPFSYLAVRHVTEEVEIHLPHYECGWLPLVGELLHDTSLLHSQPHTGSSSVWVQTRAFLSVFCARNPVAGWGRTKNLLKIR